MKKTTHLGMNRTGIATSPIQSKEAIDAAQNAPPAQHGDGIEVFRTREAMSASSGGLGSVPPPTTVKGMAKTAMSGLAGKSATVLVDKLSERLAFERTGTRFYEAILAKYDAGGFTGGPTRDQLRQIMVEENQHADLVREAIVELGADPTVQTPAADLVGVESAGLLQILTDPRTSFVQALHAIHVAELADNAGWEMLVELTRGQGHTEMATRFEVALSNERNHEAYVNRWHMELLGMEAGTAMSPA